MKKKLYLVKREVYAISIEKAYRAKGTVYEIQLAADNLQPDDKKPAGFKSK